MRLTDGQLRRVLAWLVVVLLVVPVGGALWLGVAHGESPCILCWAQRTSMMLIALVALFVVRYGPRPRYLGMLVLLGTWGVFMATRHSALHLARDIGQGFAGPILGVHTYVWAWFIHWVVLLAAGVLLLLVRGPLSARPGVEPGRVGRFAMALLVVLAAGNAVQAFISTGPPPFIGQGDPIRLSLDPRHWVWSMAELEGRVSLRGSWTVPAPEPGDLDVDPDPAHGPLVDLPTLAVSRWDQVAVPLEGTLTGLAVASPRSGTAPGAEPAGPAGASGGGPPAGERAPRPVAAEGSVLATTDAFEVLVLDGAMARVLHRVVLDPGFSIDLSPLAGATFLGDSVAVLSTNKSYVLLRPDSAADPVAEWRHFLETDGTVIELRRSRFATVRARQMYALSLAWDPVADQLITIGVPSPRHPRLVVSRFDRSDFVLSSEFLPRPGPGLRTRGPDRGLEEYVVTGAAVADGILYALSAAYSTLLLIDLESGTVVDARAVPGLAAPVGLAVRGGELLVAQADGRVAVLERPHR